MEKGEAVIIFVQFAALLGVVYFLSTTAPSQSSQSAPAVTSVYWGTSDKGAPLHEGQLTKVSTNESTITAYFSVAYSTSVSSVSASRLCVNPTTQAGESTIYTDIQFSKDQASQSQMVSIAPSAQQPGWECTYTIKVTDELSQTTTWLGTVQLLLPLPPGTA